MRRYYGGTVYILTNIHNTLFYTGVTSNLFARITDHKNNIRSNYPTRNNLKKLVYFEHFPRIEQAIYMEKKIKRWRKAWKIELIKKKNPDFRDLYEDLK